MHGMPARAAALAAVATIALTLCAACADDAGTPEDAIRRWIAAGEAAAENRDRDGLLDMISSSYADARGNTRGDIDRLLRYYFLRHSSVSLLIDIGAIRVTGGSAATVLLNAGMAGGKDGTFGFSADAWRFEFELEADGDDWLLIGARWARPGDKLH